MGQGQPKVKNLPCGAEDAGSTLGWGNRSHVLRSNYDGEPQLEVRASYDEGPTMSQ